MLDLAEGRDASRTTIEAGFSMGDRARRFAQLYDEGVTCQYYAATNAQGTGGVSDFDRGGRRNEHLDCGIVSGNRG